MSGEPQPAGKNSDGAQRELEGIKLIWKTDDTTYPAFDLNNNMLKQRITIIDVATGNLLAQPAEFAGADPSGVYKQTTGTTFPTENNYSLSFNVFQFKLVGKKSGNNTIVLNTNEVTGEEYDISWNPIGFIPYRYDNSITGAFDSEILK